MNVKKATNAAGRKFHDPGTRASARDCSLRRASTVDLSAIGAAVIPWDRSCLHDMKNPFDVEAEAKVGSRHGRADRDSGYAPNGCVGAQVHRAEFELVVGSGWNGRPWPTICLDSAKR